LDQTSKKWKQDPDEVKSAKILIEEASKVVPGINCLYTVQSICLHEETGFTAIAFSLSKILCRWGGRI